MPDKAKIIPHADVPRPYGKDLIKLPPTKMTFACLTPSGSHWMPHRARLICSRNHRSLNLTFFCIPALRGWSSQGAFECLHILYTYCKKAIFCGEKSGYFVKNANLNVRKLPFFSQGSKRAFFVKKKAYTLDRRISAYITRAVWLWCSWRLAYICFQFLESEPKMCRYAKQARYKLGRKNQVRGFEDEINFRVNPKIFQRHWWMCFRSSKRIK